MKIMVVGGGGREHAVIKKLKENPAVTEIFALPGNGGMKKDATCVNIGAKDINNIVKFAVENKIDYAVVTPDDPLCLGAVDALENVGVPCFGPNKKSAEIEGSKIFAKNLMKKYGIPTAEYEVFDNADKAIEYLKTADFPIVVKADGLALGKGVVIAENFDEAKKAVESAMLDGVFGDSGRKIVIEEFLTGPEISVLSFTDGKTIIPMISSMDHKRAKDGDKGLNTGGMGAVAPNPYFTKEVEKECMDKIFLPTVSAMNAEGRTFKGCLYFGLMLTKNGVKVIEYNCRFGDPETQVVLPLLKSDLLTIMQAVTAEKLDKSMVEFSDDCAVCVVVASDGYPEKYKTGYEIKVSENIENDVCFAGVGENEKGQPVTAGGRVLSVVAVEKTLKKAVEKAYEKVKEVSFENIFFRKDIGKKALGE